MLAPEVVANSINQFFSRKLSVRLDNGALAVYPMRLDGIQPRAFDRQPQDQYSHSAFLLYSLVMLLDPSAHFLAFMPSGIVPDKRQHSLSFFSQLPADPLDEIRGDLTHGPPIDKSQHQLVCVAPQQPITAQCLWLDRGLALFKLMKFQRLTRSPGVQLRLMQSAPPRLIFKAQDPVTVSRRKLFQPSKLLFFNAYCGSGLLIQFFARFHFTPSLEIALRISSRLTGLLTSPCSKATSAASPNVQSEVGLPNWRGGACNNARNCSHLALSRTGRTVFGRREPSSREAKPCLSKSRMTLRTVCVAHPMERAILETRSPRELASRIWQRRTVNSLRERSPASRCFRSSVVKD